MHGRILRFSREFTKVTPPIGGDAQANVDPAAAVLADYQANYTALAALVRGADAAVLQGERLGTGLI